MLPLIVSQCSVYMLCSLLSFCIYERRNLCDAECLVINHSGLARAGEPTADNHLAPLAHAQFANGSCKKEEGGTWGFRFQLPSVRVALNKKIKKKNYDPHTRLA